MGSEIVNFVAAGFDFTSMACPESVKQVAVVFSPRIGALQFGAIQLSFISGFPIHGQANAFLEVCTVGAFHE